MPPDSAGFLAGVIEGFYGPPWSQGERFELFDWMSQWGLNTYVYAPKDDLKHRALWREVYDSEEAVQLGALVRACRNRKIRFIYALSPGLDIDYGSDREIEHLQRRLAQMSELGCEDFALLFDDIPERADSPGIKHWGSLGSAQCHVANTLFSRIRERGAAERFLFCPTAYCGRMAAHHPGGSEYLSTLGRELEAGIDVFWTGPEIISQEITVDHVRDIAAILRRPPLIWDNLHANDYDGRRYYCGPYSGRTPELRQAVRGLLSNPNNEFPLNFLPLRTLGDFVRSSGGWDPRAAYLAAMREWLPRFATVKQRVAFEDLVLLGDCYYLPHEEGPEAEGLFRSVRACLRSGSASPEEQAQMLRQVRRLRDLCGELTELRHRPLFYALGRRLWDLREELDLIERYVAFRSERGAGSGPFRSDAHLPGTYRGGMIARLQRLLVQQLDGRFEVT